jgi:hypothetical protein
MGRMPQAQGAWASGRVGITLLSAPIFGRKRQHRCLRLIAYACLDHSLALTAEVKVYRWGAHCSTSAAKEPTLFEEVSNFKMRRVASGDGHSAAVTNEGQLFTWWDDDDPLKEGAACVGYPPPGQGQFAARSAVQGWWRPWAACASSPWRQGPGSQSWRRNKVCARPALPCPQLFFSLSKSLLTRELTCAD